VESRERQVLAGLKRRQTCQIEVRFCDQSAIVRPSRASRSAIGFIIPCLYNSARQKAPVPAVSIIQAFVTVRQLNRHIRSAGLQTLDSGITR